MLRSKDSHNSSKPPSSDGYGKKTPQKRTESLRENGLKPNGGQPGHKGHTLIASNTPDITTIHKVEQCEHCHLPLKEVEASASEERQVFDIPAIRIEITAHHAEIKICPKCGHENQAEFPTGVNNSIQYGNGIKTWASYFSNQHFIPVERTAQIFEDLVNHRVSEATILKASEELSECVSPTTEVIKERLKASNTLNLDESGLRVKNKLHWLHVTSNPQLTHYEVHEKRGQEAMEKVGILKDFKGTAVHDHWKPYFKYDHFNHALCNAHHLRERVEKQFNQLWAPKFANLLREIKTEVDKANESNLVNLPPEKLKSFYGRYDDIVEEGFEENPRSPPEKDPKVKKRGRKKQTPPINLLQRLKNYKTEVLAFMYDFQVPFDNNERYTYGESQTESVWLL